MKRLWRWMLNGLTALSLLMCVGTCALWPASWRWPYVVSIASRTPNPVKGFNIARWSFEVYSMRGGVDVRWLGPPAGTGLAGGPATLNGSGVVRPMRLSEFPGGESVGLHRLGFFWNAVTTFRYSSHPRHQALVGVPYWFIVAVSGALPAWAVRRAWLLRRRRPGLCPTCRYDLTGNVSGVCPECGKSIVRSA